VKFYYLNDVPTNAPNINHQTWKGKGNLLGFCLSKLMAHQEELIPVSVALSE
jgi:hypothetical protein